MAYEPQEWKPFQEGGTIITADALNYMEQGIASTSADQDELDAWCKQRDVELRKQWTADFDRQTAAFNETMEYNYNQLAEWMEGTRDTLRTEATEAHEELRSEMADIAAAAGGGVKRDSFHWSASISANTVSTLGTPSRLSGGDNVCTVEGTGFTVPGTCKLAIVSFLMRLPVSASTSGRRFTEFINGGGDTQTFDGENGVVRTEFYIGNRNGSTFVGYPGGLYLPRAYCPSAGTCQAWARVAVLY